MKKLYFLFTLMFAFSIQSQVIITEIADPNNDTQARFIELTNIGDNAFDLTGYQLVRWTNANTAYTTSSAVDLSEFGSLQSKGILTLANNTNFEAVYGVAPTKVIGSTGPADSNGDDNIAILDPNGSIYDVYGVPGTDGTGQPHEFEDGRAERKGSVTAPSSTWDLNEWNIDNDAGAGDGALDAPSGYDPGSWIGFSDNTSPSLSFSSPNNNSTIYENQLDVVLSIENFNVSNSNGDGHIHYTLDSGNLVMKYDTNPISLSSLSEGNHTLVVSLVDNSHNALNPPVESTLNFQVDIPTQVSNIGELRTSAEGEAYEISGEIILTYQQGFRNTKILQDATGGIHIDDNSGVITSAYNLGDGITGLVGNLSSYGGLLQFVPIKDAGSATSTSNQVTPVTLTLSQLAASANDYESQLVKLEGVTITGNSGETTFINGKVYTLTQGSDTFALRTSFYNFNGENLPTSAFDIVGIISERSDVGLHLVPRNYSDTTLSIDNIDVSVVNVYPNPVETSLYFSGLNEISRVTLYDLTGKLHLEATTNSSLDLSSLKKGIYILKLDNTKSSNIYKIVKQ